VKWGRDFKIAKAYLLQNAMEAFGIPTKRKPVLGFKALLFGFS
jgi:hypothetical protein